MKLGSSIHFFPPQNVGPKINYQQIEIFCVEMSNRLLGTWEFLWPQRGKLGAAKPTHSKSSGASLGCGYPAHWTPGLAQLFLCALDGVGREEDSSGSWWKKPFPFQHLFGLWGWKQGSALVFSYISPVGTDHRKEMRDSSLLLIFLLLIWSKCPLD